MRKRREVRSSLLRVRLVASLLVAALLPFLAACWIAGAYVSKAAADASDVRLTLTARGAATEASAILAATRARAATLAGEPALQRAVRRRDRRGLRLLLRPGEAVHIAGSGGSWVGERQRGVPAARAVVVSGTRRLAVVAVSAPGNRGLLARISAVAPPTGADVLALARGGIVRAGPASLRAARVAADGTVRAAGRAFRTQAVRVPGYDPPAAILVVQGGSGEPGGVGALRRRLTFVGLVSLLAIGLLAATLARPLLLGLGRVVSVAEQAMLDPLTGVANRRGFERVLAIELDRAERHGHACALVIADLDDFKLVNDVHGHDVGDEVLVTFARLLQESVRSGDTVARLGGEEFALLLPETGPKGAIVAAERARAALEASALRLLGDGRLTVTASFGVADFPSCLREELAREADQALYAAKRLGKNRVAAAARVVAAA